MTYNPTNWKDQIVTNPTRYKITKQDGNEEVVTIEREPGEVIQEGTKITAERLNNIEQGVGNNVIELDSVSTQMADLTQGTMKLGSSNTDVNKVKATELKIDTRTTELVYTDGNLTQVLEKDEANTVKTTTLNYDGNGNLTSVEEVADSTTVTTTLNYNSSTGDLESVTKAVI